jgi:hypothetical protein
MNRRQFTQRLGAIFAATTLPVPALAKVASVAPPMHQFQHPYNWAAFIARVHDTASPAMFKRHLCISDEKAAEVFDVLLRENVIAAPNAMGVSKCLEPFSRNANSFMNAGKAFERTVPDVPKSTSLEKRHIEDAEAPPQTASAEDMDTDQIEAGDDSQSVNHDLTELPDDDTIHAAPDPTTEDAN